VPDAVPPAPRACRDPTAVLKAAAAAQSSPRAPGYLAAALCARIAQGLDPAIAGDVELAAIGHQLGRKLALRGAPSGTLTSAQRDELRRRTIGASTALASQAGLARLVPIVASVHEHYDGASFPGRRAGEQIPLGARIIAAVSAWCAMRRPRDDRPALSDPEVRIRLATLAGSQLDPDTVICLLGELRGNDPLVQGRWKRP
jgi:response regulator RpfG family c-di-GMP phosphodiesterase